VTCCLQFGKIILHGKADIYCLLFNLMTHIEIVSYCVELYVAYSDVFGTYHTVE